MPSWVPVYCVHPAAGLTQARAYLGVAVIQDQLYAIGGYDELRWLNSVERYDPLRDQWTSGECLGRLVYSFFPGWLVLNCRLYQASLKVSYGRWGLVWLAFMRLRYTTQALPPTQRWTSSLPQFPAPPREKGFCRQTAEVRVICMMPLCLQFGNCFTDKNIFIHLDYGKHLSWPVISNYCFQILVPMLLFVKVIHLMVQCAYSPHKHSNSVSILSISHSATWYIIVKARFPWVMSCLIASQNNFIAIIL